MKNKTQKHRNKNKNKKKNKSFENVSKKLHCFCFPNTSCEHTNILPSVGYKFELPYSKCVNNELQPSVGIVDSCWNGNRGEYAAALFQPRVPGYIL